MMIHSMTAALSLVLAVTASLAGASTATLASQGATGDPLTTATIQKGYTNRGGMHPLRDPYNDPDLLQKDLYR